MVKALEVPPGSSPTMQQGFSFSSECTQELSLCCQAVVPRLLPSPGTWPPLWCTWCLKLKGDKTKSSISLHMLLYLVNCVGSQAHSLSTISWAVFLMEDTNKTGYQHSWNSQWHRNCSNCSGFDCCTFRTLIFVIPFLYSFKLAVSSRQHCWERQGSIRYR